MSAPAARKYEKTFSEIVREKLTGGIQRTDFVDTEEPIQRRVETYNFAPALVLTSTAGVPIFIVQLFVFSASDKKFTSVPDSVIHADSELCQHWPLLMGAEAPPPLTWNDLVVSSTFGRFEVKKSATTSFYRLKLRNLWVDGGVVVNLFTSGAGVAPDGSKIPMNKVNVMGAYSTMDFDFKMDQTDEFFEFAIAPHAAHDVAPTWGDALWGVSDTATVTHTNRDRKKEIFRREVMKGTMREKKEYVKIAKPIHPPDVKPTSIAFESVSTACNADVNTRTCMVPTDYIHATVVKLNIG